jgi:hypothetical protein
VTSHRSFLLALLALGGAACASDEWLDQFGDKLTLATPDGAIRARVSGLLDLEEYAWSGEAPGLIDSPKHTVFQPRLTLFLDAQLGARVYFFAQARADRGFDPGDRGARFRLDEYALRYTPWDDGRLSLQAGKFATVLGVWTQRHLSWDNPFISAPLPYEHVTGAADFEAPASVHRMRTFPASDKYEYLPLIWGPAYGTGFSIAGRLSKFEYAVEVKNTAPSARPESWSATEIGFSHPVVSGRFGYRPNQAWNFGVSASGGAYFRPEAAPDLPHPRAHYHQFLIGQDVSFAWHHWQLWAEIYEARFEIPRFGNADTLSYFVEAKYKIAPQLFAALRWNHQLYATMRDGDHRSPWGDDLWRLDTALGYRLTAHTQLKLQYSLQKEEASSLAHVVAAQFTVRF